MKKTSLYIAALAVATLGFTSCDEKWETPPFDVPTEGADIEATLTIAELKSMYWQDTESYGTAVTALPDGTHAIIKGTVVSSSESGNIYKSVYIQDETGAICIGVDTAAVNAVLPMGVGMALDVTGLQIGRYSGAMQLGKADGTSGVNRITYKELKPHVYLDYWSGKLDTTVVSLSELPANRPSQADLRKWGGRLVRINGVQFIEAGQPYAENNNNTSRNITDDQGNSIIVYNSPYADFANEKMPYGTGDLVGILSNYRSNWQLLLIDRNSIIDFDGEGAPEDKPAPELPEGVLTVAQALDIIASGNIPTDDVQVMGRISSIDPSSFDPSFGSLIYYIMDKDGTKSLEVYRGYWLGGEKFPSANTMKVGEYVIVQGKLVNYNGTYEFTTGSKVVKYYGDDSGDDTPSTPTPETPTGVISVADALDYIAQGGSSEATVQVKGLISEITEISTSFGNATYAIKDNLNDGNALVVYRGYWLGGQKFTSESQLEVGAEVIVEGKLVNYNGTYEFTTGNTIVSYNGQTSDSGSGDGGDSGTTTPPTEGSLTETFNSSIGLPSQAPTTPTEYTSSATGIKYTLQNCYVTSYMMVKGKDNTVGTAYFSWTLPYACSALTLTTTSGCSENPASQINLYANGTKIGTYDVNKHDYTFTIDIPAEHQAAGTVYKIESNTNKYNQQIAKLTYTEAK